MIAGDPRDPRLIEADLLIREGSELVRRGIELKARAMSQRDIDRQTLFAGLDLDAVRRASHGMDVVLMEDQET